MDIEWKDEQREKFSFLLSQISFDSHFFPGVAYSGFGWYLVIPSSHLWPNAEHTWFLFYSDVSSAKSQCILSLDLLINDSFWEAEDMSCWCIVIYGNRILIEALSLWFISKMRDRREKRPKSNMKSAIEQMFK